MTITNSAVLFNAFVAGPEALAAVDDAVLADPTAVEDLNTAAAGLIDNVVLEVPTVDSLPALQEGKRRLHFVAGALRIGEKVNAREFRDVLTDLQTGIQKMGSVAMQNALARTQRAFSLFAEPAAARETARETLGGQRRPQLVTDAEFDALWTMIKEKRFDVDEAGDKLYQFILADWQSEDARTSLLLLIEGAGVVGYLHHLSLLVTHSPELFELQHIEAIRVEAERIRQNSILQRDVTERRRMVRVADRLTALADQLQRWQEAEAGIHTDLRHTEVEKIP